MPTDRERLEQDLCTKAEEAIQKMLNALPDKAEITMSDMERLTGEMGQELMRGVMQSLSDTQQNTAEEVKCEQCETLMHKRGKRKKRIVTVRGEVEVERQYYACPNCGTGIFPPG